MTEIKYRGPLTEKQVKDLTDYLTQKGTLIESGYEQVVFFDTSIFPQIGDFVSGFSRLSIKTDKNGAFLRIKKGNPSDPKRNNIKVPIKKKDCTNLVYILNCLGLKYGYYRPVYRRKFQLQNVVISIKTKCVMGDHFEIELPNVDKLNAPRVKNLLNKFALSFWSKNKYQQRINQKMKKFPLVNVYESNIWT